MDEQILAELVAMKKLLIYALMQNGASQEDVAKALGIDRSNISRMFSPTPKIKIGRKRGK